MHRAVRPLNVTLAYDVKLGITGLFCCVFTVLMKCHRSA